MKSIAAFLSLLIVSSASIINAPPHTNFLPVFLEEEQDKPDAISAIIT
jgi:hypothetical protein